MKIKTDKLREKARAKNCQKPNQSEHKSIVSILCCSRYSWAWVLSWGVTDTSSDTPLGEKLTVPFPAGVNYEQHLG